MEKILLYDKEFEAESHEELKDKIYEYFDAKFFQSIDNSGIKNLPHCSYRVHIIEIIIESRYSAEFRKQIEDHLESEASKFTLTSSGRMYFLCAVVRVLLEAKKYQDISLYQKMCYILSNISNSSTSIFYY